MSDDSDDDEVEYEPETVTIGPFTFQILTVARMPVAVLMMNAAVGVEISGQKVWCGSIGVAQYLIESPSLVEGKLVVELGSGTGVLGMICKRLGAAKVVLTDHDDRSLSHMRLDVISNKVDADIFRFDWFNPDMAGLVETSLSSSTSYEPEPCREIVIVAGDVLYKKALLEPFFEATKLILDLSSQIPSKFSSSEMILCHIPRAEVRKLCTNVFLSFKLFYDCLLCAFSCSLFFTLNYSFLILNSFTSSGNIIVMLSWTYVLI